MIFGNYGFVSCPGVKPTVDAFLANRPETPIYLPTGHLVVRI